MHFVLNKLVSFIIAMSKEFNKKNCFRWDFNDILHDVLSPTRPLLVGFLCPFRFVQNNEHCMTYVHLKLKKSQSSLCSPPFHYLQRYDGIKTSRLQFVGVLYYHSLIKIAFHVLVSQNFHLRFYFEDLGWKGWKNQKRSKEKLYKELYFWGFEFLLFRLIKYLNTS